ncbi:hypothetical protein SISNIDRAFT_466734 [Sistotremastrum niveocremeum HHB9708]|uniref:SWIM-type domain-containing protein n=1 Tax=Sistotremastrum niveocremeum HHB9708 TaxID=1314777 RepID=A0A164TFC9_9AGAM|nr:hypothetical protein SISNIDRAFT_466734 [Sistotremastrum niveocremeum HHB9708]
MLSLVPEGPAASPQVSTNALNLELYSTLGEHDNAGFPLSYCFVSTASSIAPRKRLNALHSCFAALKAKYGLSPQFVHTDKDTTEIGAAKKLWPTLKHSICLWHLKRAVRERLAKNKLSTTPYDPRSAHSEFTFVNVDFVPITRADPTEFEGGLIDEVEPTSTLAEPPLGPNSLTIRIPGLTQRSVELPAITPFSDAMDIDNNTSSTHLDPAPIKKPFVRLIVKDPTSTPAVPADPTPLPRDRRTFCPEEYRADIVEMMVRHYNAHPLIPGFSHPSPAGIRQWAVEQMYKYCERNDLPEVWAYLWGNWYRNGRWELWSRSVHPDIPILKTTMMVESHWRRIKKDFLHHFHKPRIDLLCWILVEKLVPKYDRKLDVIMRPVARYRELAAWRKAFKPEWRRCEKTQIANPDDTAYAPNPYKWVCTCRFFVKSRFMTCKHLIQLVEPVPPIFFLEVSRRRTTPFWQHPSLISLYEEPEGGRVQLVLAEIGAADDGVDGEDGEGEERGDDEDDELLNEEMSGVFDRTTFLEDMTHAADLCDWFSHALRYQIQYQDRRFLAHVQRYGRAFFQFASDCQDLERRTNSTRTANLNTWEAGSVHTMFFRTRPREVIRDASEASMAASMDEN